MAALSSQMVRGGASGGEAAAASQGQAAPPQPLRERPSNQLAAQMPAAQRTCEEALPRGNGKPASKQQPAPLPPQQQQQQQAPPPGMQACPLCGQLLPAGEAMQRHVNEELDAFDDQEDDWPSSSSEALLGQKAGTQQQAQQGQQQLPRQQQQQPAAVLVLGGAPSITAPTDRRRLAQLQASRVPEALVPLACIVMSHPAESLAANSTLASSPAPKLCSGSDCCLPSGHGSCPAMSIITTTMGEVAG